MHTIMVIGGGLVLLAVLLGAGRWFGDPAMAAKIFLPLWLLASLVNMWVGVSRAGYTLLEELPMLAIVFGAPAILALAAWWILRA